MAKYYPDVSHHDPIKNWDKVKNNCPFVIAKATQGTSYVDTTLDIFIKNCEKKGIPYWLYTYLNSGNELEQAKFLVKTCKNKIGKHFIGYVLDVECEKGCSVSGVKSALAYISNLGYKSMIYTMYAQYSRYKAAIESKPTNCAWWEARYGKNDGKYRKAYPCHKGVDLHQFTENGSCPGIPGKIDLNRITGTKKKEVWFCTKVNIKSQDGASEEVKRGYTGTFPALPPRGYYQIGDGYKTLKNYPTQIKRVQKVLNWAMDEDIATDCKYGEETATLQEKFQKKYNLDVNGKFGNKSLDIVKKIKK